ncbi:MAG: pseudouridine synthase, partial [Candidatus Limivicinus sp.]
RTKAAAAELSRLVQQGEMKKEYLAAARGCPEQDAGILEDLLFHDQRKNKSYVVKRERKGVKKARLSFRVLARTEEASLVQVRLFTGRTHQIRVQFASRGMPLLGDARYGGGGGKLALWSVRLSFPWQGEQVCQICLPEGLGPFGELPGLAEME